MSRLYFRFKVMDTKTNKEADIMEIVLKEEWAKNLEYCDLEGFAIIDNGNLALLDECGKWADCPHDRFKVVLCEEDW